MNIRQTLSLILFFLASGRSHAQFLEDSRSREITKMAFDKLYNYQFAEARELLGPVLNKYAQHPVSHLLRASILYVQFRPVAEHPTQAREYLQELEACKKQAHKLLKDNNRRPEAIFYLLSSYGFISKYHHYRHDFLRAVIEAKDAYGYLKEGFGLSAENPDFLFTTGLYQYYRVAYPESHPMVKPLMLFFQEGNKAMGLQNLRKAMSKALFSEVEAADYLGNICLKYESKDEEALAIFSRLHQKYPGNPDFLLKYTEALLATNQFGRAEAGIANLKKFKANDFQMAHYTFMGELRLKQQKDSEAIAFFMKALNHYGPGYHTDDLRGIAYFGLGKANVQLKQYKKAETYLEKCLERCDYKQRVSEARRLLKTI